MSTTSRSVVLALTLLTGFTALVYQVAWQKYLAALLGSHSEAVAIVLGLFLGGLSYGYWLFGRISRRLVRRASERGDRPRLLVTYGAVEAGIGLYALVFPALFLGVRSLSSWLPHTHDFVSFAIDVLLTALVIGPPAVLMGATIPMLTQSLARGREDATRFHALVYAFNTCGAAAGALAAGFFLVPELGLKGTLLLMGLLNLVVGALYVALGGKEPRPETPLPEAAEARGSGAFRAYAAVAVLSGFAMMTLQTAINRIAGFSFGSSPFTFSIVVATFVLCIALGSFAVSALSRIPRALLPISLWALAGSLLILYSNVPDGPYWAHALRSVFRDHTSLFYLFWFAVLSFVFMVLLVPVALSGATLPLLFHQARSEAGTLGDVAGRLYCWNTVGSLAGALLGGYALLFWLDLHQVYRLAVLAVVAGATIVTARVYPEARGAVAGAAAVCLVTAVLLPAWPTDKLAAGAFRWRKPNAYTYLGPDDFYRAYLYQSERGNAVAFYEDGPVASIAVLEVPAGRGLVNRAIVTNGKNDSSLPGDHKTTGMLALLPAVLADKCERAFVIGYGTGLTAGELAALDTVQEVVVAEISRGVIHAAPIFEPYNQQAAGNPKTRIVRSDAYRALSRSEGTFDVITSEPSNPWVVGVETLYSEDFLEVVRSRLAAGGVFVQWIHTYETDSATLALVLNTFRHVFEHAAVWYGKGEDLLLVGFAGDPREIDVDAVESRWARRDFSAGFQRIGIRSFPAFLAHELLPAGVLGAVDLPAEIHRVLRPRLNYTAARAFFVGADVRLPPSWNSDAATAGAANSLVRRYRQRQGGGMTQQARIDLIEETCAHWSRICMTLFAQWASEERESPALRATLARLRSRASDREKLDKLAALYSPKGTATLPAGFDAANRVYKLFTRHYHHAAPFEARALRVPWERCAGDRRCASKQDLIRNVGVVLPGAGS